MKQEQYGAGEPAATEFGDEWIVESMGESQSPPVSHSPAPVQAVAEFSDDWIVEKPAEARAPSDTQQSMQSQQPSEFSDEWEVDLSGAERSWGEATGDAMVSFGAGAGSLLKMAGDIYGLTTGDMQNIVSLTGESASKYWSDHKSPHLKALENQRQKKLDAITYLTPEEQKAIFDGVIRPEDMRQPTAMELAKVLGKKAVASGWETLSSPELLTSFIFEQAPILVGTAIPAQIATRAAIKLGASKTAATALGTNAAIGTGAVMTGADAGSEAYGQLLRLKDDIWNGNLEYAQMVADGVDPKVAKHQIALRLSQNATVATGIMSIFLNKTIPGADFLEAKLAGARLPGSSLLGKLFFGAGGEALSEFTEEGFTQLSANLATEQVDPNKDIWENVAENAGQGAVAGVFGLGAGAADVLQGAGRARDYIGRKINRKGKEREANLGPEDLFPGGGDTGPGHGGSGSGGGVAPNYTPSDDSFLNAANRAGEYAQDLSREDFEASQQNQATNEALATGQTVDLSKAGGVAVEGDNKATENNELASPPVGETITLPDGTRINPATGEILAAPETTLRDGTIINPTTGEILSVVEKPHAIAPDEPEDKEPPAAATGPAVYKVNSEADGEYTATITRNPDGSATVSDDLTPFPYKYDAATAKGKTDEELLATSYQPSGFRSATPESGADSQTTAMQPDVAPDDDIEIPTDIDVAAHEAATSPANDLAQPTPAQIKAGNYKKGRIKIGGLDISVENPKGSTRSGVDPDGNEWTHVMGSHYGYLKRTTGADAEQIDVFVGPNPDSKWVFVVDQVNSDQSFDEVKTMIGYSTLGEAKAAYLENYDSDWQGLGALTSVTMEKFKEWLANGNTKLPFSAGATRTALSPRVPGVAADEGSVSESGQQTLSPLRGTGDNGVSGVDAEFQNLLGGRWQATGGKLFLGETRQQRELRTKQRGVGDASRTGEKSPEQSVGNISGQDNVAGGLGQGNGNSVTNPEEQNSGVRMDLGEGADNAGGRSQKNVKNADVSGGNDADGGLGESNRDKTENTPKSDQQSRLDRGEGSNNRIVDFSEPGDTSETTDQEPAPGDRLAQDADQQSNPGAAEKQYSDEVARAWAVADLTSWMKDIVRLEVIQDEYIEGWAKAVQGVWTQDEYNHYYSESSPGVKAGFKGGLQAIKNGRKPPADIAPAKVKRPGKADKTVTTSQADERTPRQIEREAYTFLVSLADIQTAAAGDRAGFDAKAAELLRAGGHDQFATDKAFLDAAYKEAKKRQKEAELERNRDPAIYQAKLAEVTAAAGLAEGEHDLFKQGFDHALAGRTKSTITGEPKLAGYEAARTWMKTPEGKAFFKGEKAGKLKSTGVELRRWFDKAKSDADAAAGDWELVLKALDKATARAALFRPDLDGATPGTLRLAEKIRATLRTFNSYAENRSGLTKYRRETNAEALKRYFTRTPDITPARIAEFKQLAANYIEALREISETLSGAKTVMELSNKLELLMDSSDEAAITARLRYVKPELRPFIENASDLDYLLPGKANNQWSPLYRLIEGEAAESGPSDRKTPLTRPRMDHVTRTGLPDHRKGRDITPQEFKDQFGFADVGFGKWVSTKQDQDHLNYAYDAFMDLADVLSINPTDISLGGTLYFTIGALGHGKHAAHYQAQQAHPDGGTVPVINVTNTKGDGTVAHEWLHALDYALRAGLSSGQQLGAVQRLVANLKQKWDTGSIDKAIELFVHGSWFYKVTGIRKDDRLGHARYAIEMGSYGRPQTTIYKKNADELGVNYWGNDAELFARAGEAFIYDTLADRANTYLVNTWVADGATTPPTYRGTPYPGGQERTWFNELFKAFFGSIEFTADGPRFVDEKDSTLLPILEERKAAFQQYKTGMLEALPGLVRDARKKKTGPAADTTSDADQLIADQKRREEQRLALEAAEADQRRADVTSDGALSEDELNSLFDDAAAELRESTQEQPDVPDPGEIVVDKPPPGGWTDADKVPPQYRKSNTKAGKASKLAKEAAKLGVKGIDEALTGLSELFGGKNTLRSFPGGIDEDTYAKAKPHFEAALKAFIEAGKTIKDLFKFLIQNFGEGVKPYAIRFAREQGLGANLAPGPVSADNQTTEADDAATPQETLRDNQGGDEGRSAADVRAPDGERDAGGRDSAPGAGGDGIVSGGDIRGVDGADSSPAEAATPAAGGRDNNAASGSSAGSDRAGDRVPERKRDGRNYLAPPDSLQREGSWRATAERNLDVVEIIKNLEAEGRKATAEEQAKLIKFTGWGASEIAQKLFPSRDEWADDRWKDLVQRRAALMTPEEKAAASRSTQYAHYTSEDVIRAIWSALEGFGFTGGNILEPGMGVGLFPAAAPAALMAHSRYTGIELDTFTAAIAQQLFQRENIIGGDFTKLKFPENFFDASVGNVPFAKTKILNDPKYAKKRFSLHDYFFAKSLDSLRPGGIQAFVTSRFTMDKQNTQARQYLAERADLIGAIRLPNSAFKENAGTEVVTDIIFLRKRLPGDAPAGEAWLSSTETLIDGKGGNSINEYFQNHPEMVLGTPSLAGSMYRSGEYTVLPTEEPLKNTLAAAVARLPKGIYTSKQEAKALIRESVARDFNPKSKKEGSLYLNDNGDLMVVEAGSGISLAASRDGKLSAKDSAWLVDYVPLRDAVKQAQYDQLTDGEWEPSLAALNKAYDAFVAKHGNIMAYTMVEKINRKVLDEETGEPTIDSSHRYKNLNLLREDVEYPIVMQLENVTESGDIVRSNFLTGRTIGKPQRRVIATTQDALMAALDERGGLDLDYVAQLIRKDRAEVIRELGDLIYEAPGGTWVMGDEYLSGDVVTKLEEAEAAAAVDDKYQRNVLALLKVQPKPLGPNDITIQIGAGWVPIEIYEEFADEILGITIDLQHVPATNTWKIEGSRTRTARSVLSDYGTPDRSAHEIYEAALAGKDLKVQRTETVDGKKRTYTDQEATAAANEKLKAMKEAFKGWVWTDAQRGERLGALYNRLFNNLAPRTFDGSHLTLPGLSLKYKLYDHQKRAIWRVVQTGNTYLAHAVGAGKAQPLDAKVLTPTGWRLMGELAPGDAVIAGDGAPTVVEAVFPQGEKDIHRVTFSDGSSTECCAEHLWLTQTYVERSGWQRAQRLGKSWPHAFAKVRALSEIQDTLVSDHLGAKNHSIPMVGAVQFSQSDIPLDPYLLGVLLGDGSMSADHVSITSGDEELINLCAPLLPPNTVLNKKKDVGGKCPTWHIARATAIGYGADMAPNPVVAALRTLGLQGCKSADKFIPDIYQMAAPEQRIAILQGLLDTDGSVSKRGHSIYFYSVSDALAEGVEFIVQSLGGTVSRSLKRPFYTHNGERREGQPCHVLCLKLPADITPFKLARKAVLVKPKSSYAPARYIVAVESVGRKLAQCIRVAHPSHLYVTDDFIVTHNTLEMIVAGMEMRRLGMISKPMYVVPKKMLMQFANEFLDAYPAANILVADDKNFSKENRGRFVAQAALNNPDAVIITHPAFTKLNVKDESRKRVASRFMDELEAAIEQETDKFRRKEMEAQRERLERRFAAKSAEGSKDDVIDFEDIGVDFLFVDEAHEFRKLDFISRRGAIKGIDPNGSAMALDLFVKIQHLEFQRPGRAAVLASGTPVVNTIAEIYSIMRFLDIAALEADTLDHFDVWANQFGDIRRELEQNAAGQYEFVERFSQFVNVPELMKRVRSFMDVLTSSQLGDLVARPDLDNGEPELIITAPSAALTEYLKTTLATRIEASRAWRPSPGEPHNTDPMINIISDGRLAGIDLRYVDPRAVDDPNSKLNRMLQEIIAKHKEIDGNKYYSDWDREKNTARGPADMLVGGTQIVFTSVGFGEMVMKSRGFDIKAEIVAKLAAGGIKRSQIAFMDEFGTDARKAQLFKDMRSGKVRVLFGTPKNMGTGLNVQKRLQYLHFLAPPWYPADIEQPHGRILRQGNQNTRVGIKWYAAKGTYDSTMWQMVARKQRFIEQAFTGDDSVRKLEDVSESSQYEMASALSSGDQRAIQLAGLTADIERLSRLQGAHADEQAIFRGRKASAEFSLKQARETMARYITAAAAVGNYVTEMTLVVGDQVMTDRVKTGEFIRAEIARVLQEWTIDADATESAARIANEANKNAPSVEIGKVQGKYALVVDGEALPALMGDKVVKSANLTLMLPEGIEQPIEQNQRDPATLDPGGLYTRVRNQLNDLPSEVSRLKRRESELVDEIDQLNRRIGARFQYESDLFDKRAEAEQLKIELAGVEAAKQTPDANADPGAAPATDGTTLFSRSAIVPEGASPKGVSVSEAEAFAQEFLKRYSGADDGISVRVHRTQDGAFGPGSRDTYGRVKGGYTPDTNILDIVAEHIEDIADLEATLRHEILVHKGLGIFAPQQRRELIALIAREAPKSPSLRRLWEQVQYDYADESPEIQAEELLAAVAEKRYNSFDRAWGKILDWLRAALAKIGLVKRVISRHDLQEVVYEIGRAFKEGRQARQRPEVQFRSSSASTDQAAPEFYSALARAAVALKQEKGTPEQMLNALRKTPGVKPEELEWTDLAEYLATVGKIVTRQQIVDYLNHNGVRVETVTLGASPLKSLLEKYGYSNEQTMDGEWYFADENGEEVVYEDLPDEIRAVIDQNEFKEAKYSKYVEPGGENYREVLLTLPDAKAPLEIREYESGKWGNFVDGEQVGPPYPSESAARIAAVGDRRTINALGKARNANNFHSSHYPDTPNLVVHVRIDDFYDAAGRKLMRVQEIQGDWHQQGRKYGYKSTDTLEIAPGWTSVGGELVPDAPFKNNGWVELAVKKIMRLAAEGGHDAVVWTTGKQQADRYKLSTNVRSITWRQEAFGKGLFIRSDDGRTIELVVDDFGRLTGMNDLPSIQFDGKKLSDVVGKALAEQILSEDAGDVSGNGLDIGGDGMKAFYDLIVPNVVKKVAQRLDKNARVEQFALDVAPALIDGTVQLQTLSQVKNFIAVLRERGIDSTKASTDGNPTAADYNLKVWFYKLSENERADVAELANLDYGASFIPSAAPSQQSMKGVVITDKMRAAAMLGQPLFSRSAPPPPDPAQPVSETPRPGGVSASEAADLRRRIEATPDVSVTTAGLSQEGSYKALREEAVATYTGPEQVTNSETGEQIRILKSGINNALQHGMGVEKRAVVSVLHTLLEGAAFVVRDTENMRPGVKAIETFAARVAVDGRQLVARIVVRELTDGRRFYDHELSGLEESERPAGNSGGSSTSFGTRQSKPRPTASLGKSVLENALAVNPDTGEPLGVNESDSGAPRTLFSRSREKLTKEEWQEKKERDLEVRNHVLAAILAAERDKAGRTRAERVKDWLRDTESHLYEALLWLIPRQYLPDFAPTEVTAIAHYVHDANAMDARRNELQSEHATLAERWEKYAKADPSGYKEMGEVMHLATIHGVDPAEDYVPLITPEAAAEAIKVQKERARMAPGSSKVGYFKKIQQIKNTLAQEANREKAKIPLELRWRRLSPEAQAIYRAARDAYALQRDRVLAALEARIDRTEADEGPKGNLMTLLRLEFESAQVTAPYFPLQRFGDYWVAVFDAGDDGEGGGLHDYQMFENESDQLRYIRRVESEGLNVASGRHSKIFEDRGGVNAQFTKEVAGLLGEFHPDVAKDVQDQIWQVYLTMLPELSVRKHYRHRNKIPGYGGDVVRNYAHNMFHGAHQLAKLEWRDVLEGYIQTARAQVQTVPDRRERNQATVLVDALEDGHTWAMNPHAKAWATNLTSLGFAWYLGASVGSAAVNLTQTLQIGYPVLAAPFGFDKAAAALAKASKDIVVLRGQSLSGAEKLAFAEFQRSGALDLTRAHDLAGVAEYGEKYLSAQHKAMEVVSWLFHHAERINRGVTALAAYRLAKAHYGDHDTAVDAAKSLVWMSHYNYSNANRPAFLRNDGMKVIFLFKQYPVNTTIRLGRDLNDSLRGKTPEVRRLARRRFIGIQIMSGILAGLPAMWMAFMVFKLVDWLFDWDDDEPWDPEIELRAFLVEWLGSRAADNIMTGVVDANTPVSISDRISLSDLWWRDSLIEQNTAEWLESLVLEWVGPVIRIPIDFATGMGKIADGEVWRGIEIAAPSAVENVMKGVRFVTEGVTSWRGDPVVDRDNIDPVDATVQALGLTPSRVAKQYDQNTAIMAYQKFIRDRRAQLLNRLYLAKQLDDETWMDELKAEIRQFNKANPGRAIDEDAIWTSMAARKRASAKAENGIMIDKGLEYLTDDLDYGE